MRDDLLDAIADQALGIGAAATRRAELRSRLHRFREEFEALTGTMAKQTRDRLAEIQSAATTAARAIAAAPDSIEESCRAATGQSTTALAIALHELSEVARASLSNFKVTRARDESEKKLCAWFAKQILDEFSNKRATITANGPFITTASLIAELMTGEENLSMATACREVLSGAFPGVPKS